MAANIAVEDLSLLGLFARVDAVERIKADVIKPNEEEQSILVSEGAVKKAIAAELEEACNVGLSSAERSRAKTFLQEQVKTLDPSAKAAAARQEKLSQLLAGAGQAPSKEEPAHVKRAKQALKKVEADYKVIHEVYEKWEKGKKSFKTVDELTAMKRQHEETSRCLEATRSFVEDETNRRTSAGSPPAMASASGPARPKTSGVPRDMGPAVHTAGPRAVGQAAGRGPLPQAPSEAAVRQAQMAAQVRAEAAARQREEQQAAGVAAVAAAPPQAARAQPRVSKAEEPEQGPVLSYSCTCKAVCQFLQIPEVQAREMASSSSEFRRHFDDNDWAQIQERSLAIERGERERQRELEKQKKAAALAKQTRLLEGPAPSVPSNNKIVGAGAATAKAKPAVKAKPAPKLPNSGAGGKQAPKQANLAAFSTGNRFGGFDDGSDEDEDKGGGWTQVRR